MLDEFGRLTDRQNAVAHEYIELLKEWCDSVEGPESYKEEYGDRRKDIVKRYKDLGKQINELKKDAEVLKRVENYVEYKDLIQRQKNYNAAVNVEFNKLSAKYAPYMDPKTKEGQKKILEEYPDIQDLIDIKKTKSFFTEWEKDIKETDYTEEKHAQWVQKKKEMLDRLSAAVNRYKEISLESKVSIKVLTQFSSYTTFRNKMNTAIKQLKSGEEELAKKHNEVFDKYGTLAENAENKEVKA